MKLKLIILTLLITGCAQEWQTAPKDYACSKEQMERVITETEFCTDKAKLDPGYCYGTAIMRNCTKEAK